MAPVQPIAIIGIRHVPLAAGDKCYVSFATRRKGRADVFCCGARVSCWPLTAATVVRLRVRYGRLSCRATTMVGEAVNDPTATLRAKYRCNAAREPGRSASPATVGNVGAAYKCKSFCETR